MSGGERPSTEDDRWNGFVKGMRAVDVNAIERDKHEFVPGAPHWPDPVRVMPPEAIPLPPPIAPRVAVQDQWSEPIDMVKGALVSAGDSIGNRPPPVPELSYSRPDEIATLLDQLTYGEMIELAAEIWGLRGDGDITVETLPVVLHRWSTGRK